MDDAGDACDDTDEDGIVDSVDNCPKDTNPEQEDRDGDELGDACDPTGMGGAGGGSTGTGGKIDGTLGGSGCSCRIEESRHAGSTALWVLVAGIAALAGRVRRRGARNVHKGRSGRSLGRPARGARRAAG
jgi:MYXO-CTERM domain-containing protein